MKNKILCAIIFMAIFLSNFNAFAKVVKINSRTSIVVPDKKSDTDSKKTSKKTTVNVGSKKSNNLVTTDRTKNKNRTENQSKDSTKSPEVKSSSSKISADEFELSIIAEINLMRSNPKAYAEKYIKPLINSQSSGYWTSCVSDMSKLSSLSELYYDEGLYQVSKQHSTTQGKTGQTGHTRTNGKSWSDSVKEYVSFSYYAENISYGQDTPRDILIQLLVDDGVSSLGHRVNLLNGNFDRIGVSYDEHKIYRCMCVMNFGKK